MKFSNQILTVLSLTTSIFLAHTGGGGLGVVQAADVVCDCGLETGCDQQGATPCDMAICNAGGCDQSNAGPNAECEAGGCNNTAAVCSKWEYTSEDDTPTAEEPAATD